MKGTLEVGIDRHLPTFLNFDVVTKILLLKCFDNEEYDLKAIPLTTVSVFNSFAIKGLNPR